MPKRSQSNKMAKQKEILKLRGLVKWDADLEELRQHRKLIKRYRRKAKPSDFSHS